VRRTWGRRVGYLMATTPEEEAASSSTTDSAAHSPTRPSELDLTEASTGRVWRQYLRAMGPGLVTGASDDDPSGIATYSHTTSNNANPVRMEGSF